MWGTYLDIFIFIFIIIIIIMIIIFVARSISNKYSQDLEGLLKTLGEAYLHYIRCFKPNDQCRPGKLRRPRTSACSSRASTPS